MHFTQVLENDLRIIFENNRIRVDYTMTQDFNQWGPTTQTTIMRLFIGYSSFDMIKSTKEFNEELLAELLNGQGRFMNREISQALDYSGVNATYEIVVADFDSFISNVTQLSRKIQDNKFRKAFELEPK